MPDGLGQLHIREIQVDVEEHCAHGLFNGKVIH